MRSAMHTTSAPRNLPPTLAADRSLRELARLSRGDVLLRMRRSREAAREPWLAEAFANAAPADMEVLGLFSLDAGAIQHPAVCARIVRRPSRVGQVRREAVLALYLDGRHEGEWVCLVWRDAPWGRYAGDREGEPSVLNGDRPDQAPAAAASAAAPAGG